MSSLQPLKWRETSVSASARTPMHSYEVIATENNKFYVKKVRLETQKLEEVTGFDTAQAAKDWCFNEHYAVKMQPYVKPDSITDIRNWFKAAKPEPTDKDICTQIGCHFEEIDEGIEALNCEYWDDAYRLSRIYKGYDNLDAGRYLNDINSVELLDALCDQIVTATGVAYMMGFDIEGALKEVIRSNNSKMVDGKFIFDDNGKIMKPESYNKPDLIPFISTMQIFHKGERCE